MPENPQPPDRWFAPSGSVRFHYFDGNLLALCGRWMLWRDPEAVGVEWGMAVGNARGDCAACEKKLAKLYPTDPDDSRHASSPTKESL